MNTNSFATIKKLKDDYRIVDLILSRATLPKPNKDHKEDVERKWNLALYLESYLSNFIKSNDYKSIRNYCMFLGYSRSGHSIIGALIDAHPNAIISHELNTFYFSEKGFSKNQIFSLIIKNSENFAQVGRGWSGYSYDVQGQWQGKYKQLYVIGDKLGGWTTELLRKDPSVINNFEKKINKRIKYIHHIRNPFDNISRQAIVLGRKEVTKKDIDYYLSLARKIEVYKSNINNKYFFEGHQDVFIRRPAVYIKRLCKFLGISSEKEYLKDCIKVVKQKPSQARFEIKWKRELINYTRKEISTISFLRNYEY
jgi:hypothetical protein